MSPSASATVTIYFVQPSGESQSFAGSLGDSIMDVALDNGVAGIVAQCGGGCTCCTCHCWVQEPWVHHLEKPHQDELDMLEYAWGYNQNSRLACQVKLDASMEGMVVRVPQQQA